MNKGKKILLLLFSVLLSLIFLEIVFRLTIGNPYEVSHASRKVTFYEAPNYRNVEDFVLFHPNENIKVVSLFIEGDGDDMIAKQVYSHEITTNNLGLVQKEDIKKGERIHLVLGDSFTEGEGTTAWFYDLEAKHGDLKLVNGGIKSTGPQSWELLYKYLLREYQLDIQKITIVTIGAAIPRGVFSLHPHRLAALNELDYENNFGDWYGYDFNRSDADAAMTNLAKSIYAEKSSFSENILKSHPVRRLAKRSALVVNTYLFFNQTILENETKSYDSLNYFSNLPDVKLNFVLIPTKAELIDAAPGSITWNADSQKFIDWTEGKDMSLTFCESLEGDSDFIPLDGHPNASGARKIGKAVWESISELKD